MWLLLKGPTGHLRSHGQRVNNFKSHSPADFWSGLTKPMGLHTSSDNFQSTFPHPPSQPPPFFNDYFFRTLSGRGGVFWCKRLLLWRRVGGPQQTSTKLGFLRLGKCEGGGGGQTTIRLCLSKFAICAYLVWQGPWIGLAKVIWGSISCAHHMESPPDYLRTPQPAYRPQSAFSNGGTKFLGHYPTNFRTRAPHFRNKSRLSKHIKNDGGGRIYFYRLGFYRPRGFAGVERVRRGTVRLELF